LTPDADNASISAMTKVENRAAAKAYQQEKLQRWREEAHAQAVAADLEELRRIRDHLIFRKKAGVPHLELTAAIDDYVEQLTGDRTKLHAPHQSIG
jgi:methylmalonyl-CoA mutase N-terminal domain/subunit